MSVAPTCKVTLPMLVAILVFLVPAIKASSGVSGKLLSFMSLPADVLANMVVERVFEGAGEPNGESTRLDSRFSASAIASFNCFTRLLFSIATSVTFSSLSQKRAFLILSWWHRYISCSAPGVFDGVEAVGGVDSVSTAPVDCSTEESVDGTPSLAGKPVLPVQ